MPLVKDVAKKNAEEARRAHWGTQLPIDPFAIAEEMGIDVRFMSLDPGVSGMLIREKGSDPEIILDENDSRVRQNFTCAHEIGHFVERVKRDPEGSFSFTDYRDTTASRDLHEFYADEFAGNLLMPAGAVKQLRERGLSVIEMAKRFDVSLPAMQTRLRRLGPT
ncbi:ImmA/IrrE family metallo-endopeptidase [Rhodococcus sp. NPDC055112]